ncbi:hypothetical protein ANTQUA_LOCUS9913 [Anthophora quadrimaculata]
MSPLRIRDRSSSERIDAVTNVCLKHHNKLVRFLRTGCQFFTKWPVDPNATKWRRALSRILYWIHFANELYGVLAIINGLHCCFMTGGEFAKSFVEAIFMLEILFNLIYYRCREIEFQMEDFFEVSEPKYLSHLRSVYCILTITYGIGGLLFAFVPLFAENHVIPMNTIYYMIPREKYWGVGITYAMNIVHIVNAASVVFLDLLVITIIWHATCKFSILGYMVKSLTEEELKMWIREHQNAIRAVLLLNAFLLFIPLLYAIHVYWNDPENFAKAVCMTLAVVHIFLQTFVCIGQYDNLQKLIEEMKIYCVTAKPYERDVFQRYLDEYSLFYVSCSTWFYLTSCIMILGSQVISEPFPTNAVYPFSVNFEPLRSIIFLHQAIVGIQVSAHASTSVSVALLLLFATARFELLMAELRNVENNETLIKCLKKYFVLRSYATNVASSVRFMVLISIIVCIIACVFAGINLIGKQPLTVKVQFLTVGATGLLEVFMYSLPADRLIDMSGNVMQGIYESKWYERSLRIQKLVPLMLTPLSPIIVRINFVIPVISLDFYCSYISNVFSLFTALRIVMIDEED